MGSVVKSVGSVLGFGGDEPGEKAAEAAGEASAASIQAKREAMEYLQETEELPRGLRESALKRLGGLYGLPDGVGSQRGFMKQAIRSPLYKQMMGGRKAGEQAILRSAAATGGLRSGNVQDALYDYNVQLKNQALLESYNQRLAGLTGLTSLPSASSDIAQLMGDIGETQAAGITAGAKAEETGQQQQTSNLMNLAGLGMTAFGMFSDRRLKKNIEKTGKVKGFNWYNWEWNEVANKMGLDGKCTGVMADEVFDILPEAVFIRDLFLCVNYDMILGGGNA